MQNILVTFSLFTNL